MMTGGVFAINRKFFWHIGGYDSGMYGWGGENFDISFRAWLCGGRLDIIPCSHVAHLDRFAKERPYGMDRPYGINLMRTAEVWMDEYKSLIYLFYNDFKNNPSLHNLTDRLELKRKLKCKPFSWYVKNVIPYKYIPDKDSKMYGKLRSRGNHAKIMCVDDLNKSGLDLNLDPNSYLGQYPCHSSLSSSQLFAISSNDEFRNMAYCAEVSKGIPFNKIKLRKCNGNLNQKWKLTTGKGLAHIASGNCLTSNKQGLYASTCNGGLEQSWEFQFISNVTFATYKSSGSSKYLFGRLRNERFKDMCLDSYSQQAPYLLSKYSCIGGKGSVVKPTQNFSLTTNNELRHSAHCAEVVFCTGDFCGTHDGILMTLCNGKKEQTWKLTNWNGLQHVMTNKCLTSPLGLSSKWGPLIAFPCDEGRDQIWRFDM